MSDEEKRIFHIGGVDRTFSIEELNDLARLFKTADLDPTGNITVTKFSSTADKRTENSSLKIENYKGSDDVSMSYRKLSDYEREQMGDIKLHTQLLINKIRALQPESPNHAYSVKSREYLEEAIKNAQLASMWAVKVITGPIL